MAADEGVAECPVQHGQPGQVEHTQAQHVNPPGLLVPGEHGQPDVLWQTRGSRPEPFLYRLPRPGCLHPARDQWVLLPCHCSGRTWWGHEEAVPERSPVRLGLSPHLYSEGLGQGAPRAQGPLKLLTTCLLPHHCVSASSWRNLLCSIFPNQDPLVVQGQVCTSACFSTGVCSCLLCPVLP